MEEATPAPARDIRPGMTSRGCEITRVRRIDADLVHAMGRLLQQIDPSHASPTAADLQRVVDCDCTVWLVARDDDQRVTGTLTLVVFRVPSQVRAWFENVVVDETARGRGVGNALCAEGLRLAKERGAPAVELTSRSARVAANRLYERLGFQRRETNAWRLRFDD